MLVVFQCKQLSWHFLYIYVLTITHSYRILVTGNVCRPTLQFSPCGCVDVVKYPPTPFLPLPLELTSVIAYYFNNSGSVCFRLNAPKVEEETSVLKLDCRRQPVCLFKWAWHCYYSCVRVRSKHLQICLAVCLPRGLICSTSWQRKTHGYY